MLSLSRFDLIAAVLFVIGCGLLFAIRYIGTRPAYHGGKRTNPHERNPDE